MLPALCVVVFVSGKFINTKRYDNTISSNMNKKRYHGVEISTILAL